MLLLCTFIIGLIKYLRDKNIFPIFVKRNTNDMMETNRYNAWKSNQKGEPIEGTDRILTGSSKRSILKHLAYEEGVEHQHNDVIIRCQDGTTWHVSKI